MRVLNWIIEQCEGHKEAAIQNPIGLLPTPEALDIEGLDLSSEDSFQIFNIDRDKWLEAVTKQEEFLAIFGDRLPKEIHDEQRSLIKRLKEWQPQGSKV